MRGYPDNNATGIHLTKLRCPFSDRYVQHGEKDMVESVTIIPLYFYIIINVFYDHIHCSTDFYPDGRSGSAAGSLLFKLLTNMSCVCVCV